MGSATISTGCSAHAISLLLLLGSLQAVLSMPATTLPTQCAKGMFYNVVAAQCAACSPCQRGFQPNEFIGCRGTDDSYCEECPENYFKVDVSLEMCQPCIELRNMDNVCNLFDRPRTCSKTGDGTCSARCPQNKFWNNATNGCVRCTTEFDCRWGLAGHCHEVNNAVCRTSPNFLPAVSPGSDQGSDMEDRTTSGPVPTIPQRSPVSPVPQQPPMFPVPMANKTVIHVDDMQTSEQKPFVLNCPVKKNCFRPVGNETSTMPPQRMVSWWMQTNRAWLKLGRHHLTDVARQSRKRGKRLRVHLHRLPHVSHFKCALDESAKLNANCERCKQDFHIELVQHNGQADSY